VESVLPCDVDIESAKNGSQIGNLFVFGLPLKEMQAKTGGH
jgi:hypothetical protein